MYPCFYRQCVIPTFLTVVNARKNPVTITKDPKHNTKSTDSSIHPIVYYNRNKFPSIYNCSTNTYTLPRVLLLPDHRIASNKGYVY